MLVSYKWLCELAGVSPSPQELADKLTFSGIEVDSLRPVGVGFDKVVVGEIKSYEDHPSKDRLHVVTVDVGDEVLPIVCGAANCPRPGGRVVVARPGATVGSITIEPRKLAGVPSHGMLCSEAELDIGPDDDGIIILPGAVDVPVGTPIAQALELEDWILEVSITPNRPDALSHRGLARDVALLHGVPFAPKVPEVAATSEQPACELATVEVIDAAGCPRYGAAVVTGLEVALSPFALRYRLHNLGIRPISNIVDMTNLVLLEYGQPLHAFDLDLLEGAKVVVRSAAPKELIATLDGEERVLAADDVLICDGKKAIAIGGVMGGETTGVTGSTRNILIECAYFNPSRIRRTSKRLKLSSESSYRFERGVDPNAVPEVLGAAASLAVALAGGKQAPGIIDCYPEAVAPKQISLRPARYRQVMGADVPVQEMRRILEGLGAEVAGSDDQLEVQVPTTRPDIEREIDLVEEVARIWGYDKVPITLPRVCCLAPQRDAFEAARKAKKVLTALGLDESVSYSFVPEELQVALGFTDMQVRITNPLNAERAVMRRTLLVGLLENLKRTHSRFLSGLRQFEVGHTFADEGGELPCERLQVAGILSGPRDSWVGDGESSLDYYDVKGIVASMVDDYSGVRPEFTATEAVSYLHPKRAAAVKVKDLSLGSVGELHPAIVKELKLPAGVQVFELDVDALGEAAVRSAAQPIPEYPPMVRDVALLVDEAQDAGPIGAALEEAAGPLALGVTLFDLYRGKGVPDGKKSLAFSVTYQALDRTLTDDEVDRLHGQAVAKTAERFSATQKIIRILPIQVGKGLNCAKSYA